MRWSTPSERNYSVFCAVEFDQRSLRRTAEEFGVSVVRVQQIVEQVRQWFVASAPAWVRSLPPVVQPLVAAQVYEQRLQHLSRQAMEAWEASQGERTVTQQRAGMSLYTGEGTTKTFHSAGDPKYLALCARLAEWQLKNALRVADWRLKHRDEETAALAAYADLPEHLELSEDEPHDEHADASPCAREASPDASEADDTPPFDSASADDDDIYDMTSAPVASRAALVAPPVRSRKERRKRQRMLERAMAKRR